MTVARPPAVFLDRDGVIVRGVVRSGKPFPPPTAEAVEILPGVAETLRSLRGAGFRLVVVTNQPDVATGIQRRETVETIHARLMRELALDDIRMCCHIDADGCECRKPKPGMLLAAARDLNLDLSRSAMVGDRWRDIEAGAAAGCRTVFIDYDYAEPRPQAPDRTVRSLADALPYLLSLLSSEAVTP